MCCDMLSMVQFNCCIGATNHDSTWPAHPPGPAAIGCDRPRSAAIGRDGDANIYQLKWPSSAPSALLLPQACCRGYAAGAMLQGLCCTGYAAGATLLGLCCRGYATGAMLLGPSCWGYAAGATLQGLCCTCHAARAMLQGHCCTDYAARATLQGLCCRDCAALKVVGAQRGSVLN